MSEERSTGVVGGLKMFSREQSRIRMRVSRGFEREGVGQEEGREESGDWKSRGLCWRVHDGYVPGLYYGLGATLFFR